jgi:hypothetical protein
MNRSASPSPHPLCWGIMLIWLGIACLAFVVGVALTLVALHVGGSDPPPRECRPWGVDIIQASERLPSPAVFARGP